MKFKLLTITACIILMFPLSSAFHFLYGNVQDALDTTPANDLIIVVWNPLNGVNDNLTDIIGPNGNSYTDNYYLIDCENLNNPCSIGENLTLKVIDQGDGYTTYPVNVTITGAGFDIVESMRLNSLPVFNSIIVDDSFDLVLNEIDLFAGTTREVMCSAVIEELDGDPLTIYGSEFFDSSFSYYGDKQDNNFNYKNNSCFVNSSYGNENETLVNCTFEVYYYANSTNWDCEIIASDVFNNKTGIDLVMVNPLLSLEVGPSIDYGGVMVDNISEEFELVVSNMGNVQIDLALSGYGIVPGDNNSMVCEQGAQQNITVGDEAFNLTTSNLGVINELTFRNLYSPLTNLSTTNQLDLDFRFNDLLNDANKSTYWRIYAPSGVFGNCTGNIVFGAVAS